MNANSATGGQYIFNLKKSGIPKYKKFLRKVNKKYHVSLWDTDKSVFFIYSFFNMLESMTIIRTNN